MYKIFISKHFKKQLKPLVKKDGSLKDVLKKSLKNFGKDRAIAIGAGIFKLRLRKHDSGKSGGYRMYVFLMEVDSLLTPVCIYSKSDRESIGKGELADHVEVVKLELEELL